MSVSSVKAPSSVSVKNRPLSSSKRVKIYKPTEIKEVLKLDTSPFPAYKPVRITHSSDIIKNNGFSYHDQTAMRDITKDSRYQHLKERVAEKWDSLQSSGKSTADTEKDIATFAVKNMHDLFGNYDRLISRLHGKVLAGNKLSHSEQEYFDQNHKKNAPLSEHPRGSFRSAQYNHVLSHLLKDVANIDSTVISAPITRLRRNGQTQHGSLSMTYLNSQDTAIAANKLKHPIFPLAKQTKDKILSKESDVIQLIYKGRPSHKYHIHPVLDKQQVAISKMANGLKKQRRKIKKATMKDPLPAVRNAILDHVISSKTHHHSPNDLKYLKFMFENEQPFFKKLDAKKAKK